MARYFLIFAFALILGWPQNTYAAENKINISVISQEDGSTYGEIWYNESILWRLALCLDGAKPVFSKTAPTTFITPDIVNGLFYLKVSSD